jgi:hypothetical protein
MKSWLGVAAIIAAFIVGGIALIAGSLTCWVLTAILLVGGIVLERSVGWGADETTGQHPLAALRDHGTQAGR